MSASDDEDIEVEFMGQDDEGGLPASQGERACRTICAFGVMGVMIWAVFNPGWHQYTARASPESIYNAQQMLARLVPGLENHSTELREVSKDPEDVFNFESGILRFRVRDLCQPVGKELKTIVNTDSCKKRLGSFCDDMKAADAVDEVKGLYEQCSETIAEEGAFRFNILFDTVEKHDVWEPDGRDESVMDDFAEHLDDVDPDLCETMVNCNLVEELKTYNWAIFLMLCTAIVLMLITGSCFAMTLVTQKQSYGSSGCHAMMAAALVVAVALGLDCYVSANYSRIKMVHSEDLVYFILPGVPDEAPSALKSPEALLQVALDNYDSQQLSHEMMVRRLSSFGEELALKDTPELTHEAETTDDDEEQLGGEDSDLLMALDEDPDLEEQDLVEQAMAAGAKAQSTAGGGKAAAIGKGKATPEEEMVGSMMKNFLKNKRGEQAGKQDAANNNAGSGKNDAGASQTSVAGTVSGGEEANRTRVDEFCEEKVTYTPSKNKTHLAAREEESGGHKKPLATIPKSRWQGMSLSLVGKVMQSTVNNNVSTFLDQVGDATERFFRMADYVFRMWVKKFKTAVIDAPITGEHVLGDIIDAKFDLEVVEEACIQKGFQGGCRELLDLEGLEKKVKPVLLGLKEPIDDVIKKIKDLIRIAYVTVEKVVEMWVTVKDPVIRMPEHIKKIVGQVGQAKDTVTGLLSAGMSMTQNEEFINDLKELFNAVFELLPQATAGAIRLAKDFWNFVTVTLPSFLKKIVEAVKTVFSEVQKHVSEVKEDVFPGNSSFSLTAMIKDEFGKHLRKVMTYWGPHHNQTFWEAVGSHEAELDAMLAAENARDEAAKNKTLTDGSSSPSPPAIAAPSSMLETGLVEAMQDALGTGTVSMEKELHKFNSGGALSKPSVRVGEIMLRELERMDKVDETVLMADEGLYGHFGWPVIMLMITCKVMFLSYLCFTCGCMKA